MFREAPSPNLFAPDVSQHSIHFAGEVHPSEKRQLEFSAGRWCATHAIRRRWPELQAGIEVGAFGEPLWPVGLVGSITHVKDFASAVVARSDTLRGLGLDCEHWITDDTIAARVATAAELAAFEQTTGWPRVKVVTLVFSAKESVYKCLFPTLQRRLDFPDVTLSALEAGRFSARVDGLVVSGKFEEHQSGLFTGVEFR